MENLSSRQICDDIIGAREIFVTNLIVMEHSDQVGFIQAINVPDLLVEVDENSLLIGSNSPLSVELANAIGFVLESMLDEDPDINIDVS